MTLDQDLDSLYRALRQGLVAALGDKLYGIYVYGAVAFPESDFTGDVDFHAILTAPPTAQEHHAIDALHAALASEFPPLGVDMDGYYILLDDARLSAPPVHLLRPDIVDGSWALHRAHILAGRCIVVHGPDPQALLPPATWPELESALLGELAYVEENLDRYPDYCILNLCRLIYSFQTQDVVTSKAAAAQWALDALPAWSELVEAARRSYAGQATPEDREQMASQVKDFHAFACARIKEHRMQ